MQINSSSSIDFCGFSQANQKRVILERREGKTWEKGCFRGIEARSKFCLEWPAAAAAAAVVVLWSLLIHAHNTYLCMY